MPVDSTSTLYARTCRPRRPPERNCRPDRHRCRSLHCPRQGAHRQHGAIGRQREAEAELVARARIRCLDVRLLTPGCVAACEHVDRTAIHLEYRQAASSSLSMRKRREQAQADVTCRIGASRRGPRWRRWARQRELMNPRVSRSLNGTHRPPPRPGRSYRTGCLRHQSLDWPPRGLPPPGSNHRPTMRDSSRTSRRCRYWTP